MIDIDVDGLGRRDRGHTTLTGITLEVEAGKLHCLLGPNGAGKTTLLSILTTGLAPSSGRARVAGFDLAKESAQVRRHVGVVFQRPALDRNLSGEHNLRLHAQLYGTYPWRPWRRLVPADYRARVGELSAQFGLEGQLERPARELSGGMQRRVEIARALLSRPRVLFLDEPTAGLDPQSRHDVWACLQRLRGQTTILLTTHLLEEAETADAVTVLLGGRVLATASPNALRQRLGPAAMLLDSPDRASLRRQLRELGIVPQGDGPLRIELDQCSPQAVVSHLRVELSVLSLTEPTLEDAYLHLLGQRPL